MNELEKDKEVVALEKKLRKESGGKDYIDDLRKLDRIELENKLKDLAKYRQAVLSTRKIDTDLIRAKARVSNLNLPYSQDLNANDAKSRFIGLLIQEIEGFTPTEDVGQED